MVSLQLVRTTMSILSSTFARVLSLQENVWPCKGKESIKKKYIRNANFVEGKGI